VKAWRWLPAVVTVLLIGGCDLLPQDDQTYHTRGPDFRDTRSGVKVELTTVAAVAVHKARRGYGPQTSTMRYVTYLL
jgi:hypothetical protein